MNTKRSSLGQTNAHLTWANPFATLVALALVLACWTGGADELTFSEGAVLFDVNGGLFY